ncbi:MAG: hypothetical protein WCI12_05500 [Actinomycetes bacterium]
MPQILPRRRQPLPPGPFDGPIDEEPLVLPPPSNPDFYDPGWDDWRQPRRWPIVALAIVLILGAVLVGAYKVTSKTSTTKAKSIPTVPSPTTFQIPTAPSEPKEVVLTGKSDATPPSFPISGGMVVFSATTTSPWQFGVTLLDANGNFVDVLYNVLGSVNGSVVRSLEPGTYQIKVTAKDAWTVTVRQPAPNTEPLSLPSTHSGVGPSIIGPFPAGMPLSVLFGFLSNGDVWPPASVQVIYLDGRKGSILMSETSQKIVTVHLAASMQPFYLQAFALGNWQLTVSDASRAKP